MPRCPAVYILASRTRGTLYVGVTSNLVQRIWQHRTGAMPGSFTRAYGVHRLVYFEVHRDMRAAIAREKQLKRWNRAWKVALVEQDNPAWNDLWVTLLR